MKIQKILPNQVNKNLSIDNWREINLYNYINEIKPENQCFSLNFIIMIFLIIVNINKKDNMK
jgi:hypothetical protein